MKNTKINVFIFRTPIGSLPEPDNLHAGYLVKKSTISDTETPIVFVLRWQDINSSRDLFEVGEQHKGKELGSILLTRKGNKDTDKCYVLHTKYRYAGTFTNAIMKFFKRACKAPRTSRAYLVCVDDTLFDALADRYNCSRAFIHSENEKTEKMGQVETVSDQELTARSLVELLESDNRLKTSPALEKNYRGSSYLCRLVRHQILAAAEDSHKILIQGGRGTGKELVARAIHDNSERKNGPFVAVNISAISSEIFEAEMFGVKPNYPNSGSPGNTGLMEAAHKGTLFLDEIGDMPLHHQPKILRAIMGDTGKMGKEDRGPKATRCSFKKVGESKPTIVDVRILAATNQNLQERDKNGKHLFRQDLYGRLSQLIIQTPDLDAHREDIPDFATSFWKQINQASNLPSDLIDLLKDQRFDNNVRELENILLNLNILFPENPTKEKLICILKQRQYIAKEPVSQERIDSPDLVDLIDVLAGISHEKWRENRAKEGYVWGPKRVETEKVKTNPDMMDFQELSESQKSYSREEAKAILRGLLDRGYMIR